jgi:hypothetical protein
VLVRSARTARLVTALSLAAALVLPVTALAGPGVPPDDLLPDDVPAAVVSVAGCHTWDPSERSLQAAVMQHACVEVPAGVHELDRLVAVPGGHVLRGAAGTTRDQVVLRAKRSATWPRQLGLVKSGRPFERPVVISGLTVDGNSRKQHRLQGRGDVPDGAHVGISAPSMVVHDVVVRNARCVGISAYEDLLSLGLFTTVVTGSEVTGNGFACAAESAPPGGGVYVHPVGDATDRVVFQGNHVHGNDGSGFDLDGVDGGVLVGNTVVGNSVVDGFAAVSLVDASGWLISGNTIVSDRGRGKVNCPGGPAGRGHSGLFVCARTRDVTGNVIVGNTLAGHYGLLVNRRGKAVATGNVVRDNTVTSTSRVRCGEGNAEGANTWEGNTCGTGTLATVSSEPPVYFTP